MVKRPATSLCLGLLLAAVPCLAQPAPPTLVPARGSTAPAVPPPDLPPATLPSATMPTAPVPTTAPAAPSSTSNDQSAPEPSVVLPALPPEPPLDATRTLHLTLDEAYQVALAKSPRIGNVLARIRETQANADASGAPLRPQGVASVTGPPPPPGLAALRNNLAFAPVNIQISKLLFDGGRIWAKVRQMKAQARGDAATAQVEWQQIHLDVTLAYYEVLKAQVTLEVAQGSLNVTRGQVEENTRRFAAGDLPKGDILSAQVPAANAELESVEAASTVRDRVESLNLLLGLPLDTPLVLETPPRAKPLEQGLDACIAEALAHRPNLVATRMAVEAADQAIIAARNESAPRVSVQAGLIGYQTPDSAAVFKLGPEGGVQLTWPFLDGNLSGDLARAARAAKDQQIYKLMELERECELEVRQSYRAVELARHTQTADAVSLMRARDAFRIANAQYQAGLTSYYNVRQAQLDLVKAEQASGTAVFDYLAARARLDHARGQVPSPEMPLEDSATP